MSNPAQRDDIHGTAASASAESYRARREGNLTRGSDGFRLPPGQRTAPRPYSPGFQPHEMLGPYRPNPVGPARAPFPDKPNTFAFLREADLGAPYVGFPERRRTQGKLQPSGAAWGRIGEPERPKLAPPIQGEPTKFERTDPRTDPVVSTGPRWKRPTSPHIYDHLPH
jgi:hypothetical protein